MTCYDREQDLLLLLHGELPPLRRRLLLAHLSRCSRCRQHKEKLSDVCSLIAGAIRAPDMPPWLPERNRGTLPYLRSYTLFVVLLVLVAGLLVYTKSAHSKASHPVTSRSQQLSETGCAPNLPNDHCH